MHQEDTSVLNVYRLNNRKEENFQINNLEKGEQSKLQVRARKEIIKIRIEINETETNSQSTENLKKMGSHLARSNKNVGHGINYQPQRCEGVITRDPTDTRQILRKYYTHSYDNKFNNVHKMKL